MAHTKWPPLRMLQNQERQGQLTHRAQVERVHGCRATSAACGHRQIGQARQHRQPGQGGCKSQ
eukprot:14629580-Heterocapsa_arctica.AAC.1